MWLRCLLCAVDHVPSTCVISLSRMAPNKMMRLRSVHCPPSNKNKNNFIQVLKMTQREREIMQYMTRGSISLLPSTEITNELIESDDRTYVYLKGEKISG